MLSMIAALAAGASLVGISNQNDRQAALTAPEIGLGDISACMQSLVERAELTAQQRSLQAQIGKKSTEGPKTADQIRLDSITDELNAPAPARLVCIEAVAELDKISHEATAMSKAADNPVYQYTLKNTDGTPTEYKLVCHQQFAPDQRPVNVRFAMDLTNIMSHEGSFFLMPASFPGIVALPGSGEAILRFSDANN